MLSATEQGELPQLTRGEQGDLQAQMLVLAGEAAHENRVEVLARMMLTHPRLDDDIRPGSGRQLLIFDAFAPDRTVGMFRYDRRDEPDGIRSSVEVVNSFSEAGGIDEEEHFGVDDNPERIMQMLKRAIEVGSGTTVWPKGSNERDDNPVMGNGHGSDDAVLRPRALFPVIGQVMAVGGKTLLAAGGDSSAQLEVDINAGMKFYGSRRDNQHHLTLWARNDEGQADLSLRVKPINIRGGIQLAFTDVQLCVDEKDAGGKLRRAVSTLFQQGDSLKNVTRHSDGQTPTERSASLDTIIEMAQRVERITDTA
jgi:hypothetical protein